MLLSPSCLADVPDPGDWSLPLMRISQGCYSYTQDLLALNACTSLAAPPSWPPYTSPVLLTNLLRYLQCHPDQEFAHYVYNGLSGGFQIGFNRDEVRLKSPLPNHSSSRANPRVIEENLASEVPACRLIGPLPVTWTALLHNSPLD